MVGPGMRLLDSVSLSGACKRQKVMASTLSPDGASHTKSSRGSSRHKSGNELAASVELRGSLRLEHNDRGREGGR